MSIEAEMENIEDIYALTPMQEGMLLHSLLDEKNKQGIYHQQLLWDLEGDLNLEAFSSAWQEVIHSYTILRTGFFWKDLDKSLQVVFPEVPFEIKYDDWSCDSNAKFEDRLSCYLNDDIQHPFLLDTPPLMRFALIKSNATKHTFVWSHHHIILDGWSAAIVLTRVMEIYDKLANKMFVPSLKKEPAFVDYIKWLQQCDKQKSKTFWQKELQGFTAPLDFREKTQNTNFSQQFQKIESVIPQSAFENLLSVSKKKRWTLATMVQAAWALTLSRFAATKDVVFGTTVSGRSNPIPNIDNMVGLFINTLPLRIKIENGVYLSNWIDQLQIKQNSLKEWEYVSLSDIQSWSEIAKGEPLFQTILVFENYPVRSYQSNLKVRSRAPVEKTNYPLTCSVGTLPTGGLSLQLSYDIESYSDLLIQDLFSYFEKTLQSLPEYIEHPIDQFPSLTPQQQQKVLMQFQGKRKALPPFSSLSQTLEAYAKQQPDQIALVASNQAFSYQELNAHANQLAYFFLSMGIKAHDCVAVGMDRSEDLIATIFALWKIGAAYIPIDLKQPHERLLSMLDMCKAKYFIVNGEHKITSFLTKIDTIDLCLKKSEVYACSKENLNRSISSRSLAYVIFTSGSTGIPKAVMVEHGNIINIAEGWAEEYCLSSKQAKLLQVANFTFDVFVGDLARCYYNGITMVICSEETRLELPKFYELLFREKISLFESTPGLILPLMEYVFNHRLPLPELKLLILGSDLLKTEDYHLLLQRFGSSMRIVNSYGITEATIDTSYFEASSFKVTSSYVPIGKPFSNNDIYILDEDFSPAPIGIKGELFIGGLGVSRGYYQEKVLTAEKFLPNPFKSGERMYRTGDFGRWLPDGNVEFLGRLDDQVKIRGYRISLSEITQALYQFPGIFQAITHNIGTGSNTLLCGYYTAKSQLEENTLRKHLEHLLPAYMIPHFLLQVDHFKLSTNGKVDRKALPKPSVSDVHIVASRKPANEIEHALCLIWKELLQVQEVDPEASFFEIGGNSLLILNLFNKIKKTWDIELSVADLFAHHTVSSLSGFLTKQMASTNDRTLNQHLPKTLDQIMHDLEQGKISIQEAEKQMELITI